MQSQNVETGSVAVSNDAGYALAMDSVIVRAETTGRGAVRFSTEADGPFTLIHADFDASDAGEYRLTVSLPFVDIHRTWAGMFDCWTGRELTSVGLKFSFQTASNRFVPAVCNFNRTGQNRYLVGLLNHVPLTTVRQQVDISHPLRWLNVTFTRHRSAAAFRETIVLGRKSDPFAEVIAGYGALCRRRQGIAALPAPDWSRDPVWCSWYAFVHSDSQERIERQLPLAASLGFQTILIDALWQSRFQPGPGPLSGCGDFLPNTETFPDLKGLVARIRDHGLRAVLWCAPLWVGSQADNRQRMEKYLVLANGRREDRLNPFSRESVQHMREVVGRLMSDYELNGLKIDFMDTIEPQTQDPAHNPDGRDFGAAMADVMAAMRDEIVGIKSDALIEYRIRYSNLVSLAYANCHRGNDSPFDPDYIRRENLFLRLLADPAVAVHSDYAYWHPDESPENISLALGQQVFSGGVPTVSVDLPACQEHELEMIRRWLGFYRQHRQALAAARVRVHSADAAMSVSSLESPEFGSAYVLAAGNALPRQLQLDAKTRQVWILNASAEAGGQVRLDNGQRRCEAQVQRWTETPFTL